MHRSGVSKVCGDGDESTLHAVHDCHAANHTWRQSFFHVNNVEGWIRSKTNIGLPCYAGIHGWLEMIGSFGRNALRVTTFLLAHGHASVGLQQLVV